MRRLIPVLVTVATVAAMVWQARIPEAELMPAPEIVLPDIPGAVAEEQEMTEAERHTLPPDTVIRRRLYRLADGNWVKLSAVVGGRSKSSVHRPELCLPSQGFQMTDPHTVEVGGVSWRRLTIEKGGFGSGGFAYTFDNGRGFRTSSHLLRIFADVWNRSILGRIDRWVMVTVSASCGDEAFMRSILEKTGGLVK